MKKIAIEEHLPKDKVDQIEERLKDMDEAGIDMQVLSCIFPFDKRLDPKEAASIARANNNMLARIVEMYPERFASFATLAFQDPNAAANELERAVGELGLKGTMMFSNLGGDYLDNPKYGVILEMAAKLDVPIYIHPSELSPGIIEPYLTYPILSTAVWGYAAEVGLHAMRMIFGGVFDKYPRLKVILGHLGEGIPYWLWRIDHRWIKDKDKFKSDVSTSNLQKKPTQYFRDNFYVTTSGMFWHPVLQYVYTVLGADRILFAVDYPQESNVEAVKCIESMPISDSDKEKIFHLNAERLLKL
jgi:predicted TIM-barrel fold metal-dependent hydrolase